MTINELLMESEMARLRALDKAWLHFEEEARAMTPRPGLRNRIALSRQGIAAGLVRLGGWIDRSAYERVAAPPRQEVVR